VVIAGKEKPIVNCSRKGKRAGIKKKTLHTALARGPGENTGRFWLTDHSLVSRCTKGKENTPKKREEE